MVILTNIKLFIFTIDNFINCFITTFHYLVPLEYDNYSKAIQSMKFITLYTITLKIIIN